MIPKIQEPIKVFRHFVLDRWDYGDRYKVMPVSTDLAEVILSVVEHHSMCDDCASVDYFIHGLVSCKANFVRRSFARLQREAVARQIHAELDLDGYAVSRSASGQKHSDAPEGTYEWSPIANLAIDSANRRGKEEVDTVDFLGAYFALLKKFGLDSKAQRLARLMAGTPESLAKNIASLANLRDSEAAWAIMWVDGRFQALPLASLGLPALARGPEGADSPLADIVRASLVNNVRLILSRDLALFEDLLNSEDAQEQDFQEFFEAHPQFLLIDDYVDARSHLTLHHQAPKEDAGFARMLEIPDFFLESVRGLADIAELKSPRLALKAGGGRAGRASAEITKAVRQLFRYRAFFCEPQNRSWFEKSYGLKICEPRLILIIGRSAVFERPEDRKDILLLPSEVSVYTYDDLLTLARERMFIVEG